jgi:hypothetical protein
MGSRIDDVTGRQLLRALVVMRGSRCGRDGAEEAP